MNFIGWMSDSFYFLNVVGICGWVGLISRPYNNSTLRLHGPELLNP